MPATRQLRRDAEANRRHILEAAGQLMAERGLAAPLEEIAAAAGVGIATLYRRFPTRDDLIEALFEDRVAAYLADLETAARMADGWEGLIWFLKSAAARQIADRALNELLEHDPGPGVIRQLLERVWPLAEQLVKRAKSSGRLRSDFTVADLTLVQQMLVAAGTATSAASDTAWQRYLTLVIDGLVASRPAPSAQKEPALSLDQLEALHAIRSAVPRRRPG